MFGNEFGDPDTYTAEPPSTGYLESLLVKEHIVAIAALAGEEVLGGLVAYELEKFERERREFYIYDLAVSAEHRRRRIATFLIEHLREIAAGLFHLHCQSKAVPDPLGADLRDPDQAWEAARKAARDLMQGQTDAEVNWLTCHFKVTDEAGEIVFELPFTECVEVKKLPN